VPDDRCRMTRPGRRPADHRRAAEDRLMQWMRRPPTPARTLYDNDNANDRRARLARPAASVFFIETTARGGVSVVRARSTRSCPLRRHRGANGAPADPNGGSVDRTPGAAAGGRSRRNAPGCRHTACVGARRRRGRGGGVADAVVVADGAGRAPLGRRHQRYFEAPRGGGGRATSTGPSRSPSVAYQHQYWRATSLSSGDV